MLNQSATLDQVFHALSDPARRAMVKQLTRSPASVSELARPLTMSLPPGAADDVGGGGDAARGGAGGMQARPVREGRRGPHLPHRAGHIAGGRGLDQPAAHRLGRPSRPARRVPGRAPRPVAGATRGEQMMTDRYITHATFSIERVYRASPQRVFAAWADPAAKARWFAGPGSEHQLDFRVGGREVARGRQGGAVLAFESVYRGVVPGERIVYSSVLSSG